MNLFKRVIHRLLGYKVRVYWQSSFEMPGGYKIVRCWLRPDGQVSAWWVPGEIAIWLQSDGTVRGVPQDWKPRWEPLNKI